MAAWLLEPWNPRLSVPQPTEPTPPTSAITGAGEGELEWILAAQAGDRTAFAALTDRYWDRLYRWLYHLTGDPHRAEDLAQETFLKALAAIQSFRAGSNFRAWLFRIGHNNFVNLKRSERRTPMALPDETTAPAAPAPADVMADRENVAAVLAAIEQLPVDFRTALLLHTQEELSYREIAKIVRTTEETARWRVFKARQKLMKLLAPELIPGGEAPETRPAG
ncbi:MAG: RNA polymerase sigma factor [Gemmataceae bacterium]